jgi:hypothetical protein
MLPLELFQDIIIYFLQPNEVIKLSRVSRFFKDMYKQNNYWNSLFSFNTNGLETYKMLKKMNFPITENALKLVLLKYSGNEHSLKECVTYVQKQLKLFVILDIDLAETSFCLNYPYETCQYIDKDFWNSKNNVLFVDGKKVNVKNYNEDLFYKYKQEIMLDVDEFDFIFDPEDNRSCLMQQEILKQAKTGLL